MKRKNERFGHTRKKKSILMMSGSLIVQSVAQDNDITSEKKVF